MASLSRRVLPARLRYSPVYWKAKVLVLLLAAVFVYGTLGYVAVKGVGVEEGLALTAETLAFEHEREETAVGRILQVTLVIFGVFVLWFALWTLGDLVLEGELAKYWREVKWFMQESSLKDHYVICGAGRVGVKIGELLRERKLNTIILDKDASTVERLRQRGVLAALGDALDETVLREAGVEHARGLVAVLPETEKNIVLTLTAKSLNPTLTVYARAESELFVKQLRAAGAKHIVLPEVEGAKEVTASIGKEEEAGKAKAVDAKK